MHALPRQLGFILVLLLLGSTTGCGDNSDEQPALCGDGVTSGNEQCDDGNATDGDGCNADCTIPGCGDGIVAFDEACDDGNQINGDGCDNNCKQTYCGNGILTDGESCDDGNRTSGDGCDNNCTATRCGNGEPSPGEACDDGNTVDGDGCDSNCTASACGNGIQAPDEQCDDGNTASADGCSASCTTETLEVEPNEDGTPSTGATAIAGNDFASAHADSNGAFTGSATVIASLDPAGDEDVFAITNTGAAPVTVALDVWNLAAGYGIGVPCGSSIDTGMHVRDAAGTSLASNDDRASASDLCSALDVGLLPGQTRYVHVVAYDDDSVIGAYALEIVYAPVVCGNGTIEIGETCDDGNTMAGDGCDASCQIEVVCGDGVLQPGEQCDDHNTNAGDGCSPSCQLEGAVSEVEPNEDGTPSTGGTGIGGNDFGSANADANGAFTGSVTIAASLSPAGDEDVFAFSNPTATPVNLRLDIWNLAPGYGLGVPCSNSIDTGLHVRDAAGTSLASGDDRNGTSDQCSGLTYTLAPGATVYAHVVEYGDNAAIQTYALQAVYTPIVCGNGAVEAGEQCDDGNMMNGDGCSATCQIENTATETEPNDDGAVSTGGGGTAGNDFSSASANGPFTGSVVISAALSPAGDEDVFAFTNTGSTAVMVRFDVWNLAAGYGVGVACGSSIDTGLHVRDASGTSLASNDDRNGASDLCSGLTYSIAAGATVYVQVVEFGDDAEIASYALQATYP
jgi:cysteine-rich repeat protein